MVNSSYRDAWVEISLDAIKENAAAFRGHIDEKCRLMAVVKADGYGHGAIEVAKAALDSGADYLAVAILDEAIELRKKGIAAPILVLGYTAPAAVSAAIENNIALTVFQSDVIEQIAVTAGRLKKTAYIHLKIDSGMHRIGIQDKAKALELIRMAASPFVKVEGIFTHFADADNADTAYTMLQFNRFMDVIQYLEQHHIQIPIKHCCNSAAAISDPSMHLDMVRIGISLYGLYPDENMQHKIKLKQAMNFKTKPVMIKTVEAGEPISYGCTFKPKTRALIATIPIGYADGFSRSLSNKGNVVINGKRAPIVGRICMDQAMIDVTGIGQSDRESIVSVFGDPKEGFVSLAEAASIMDTIHYEVVCLIGKRVPRVYIENGTVKRESGLLHSF